MAKEWQSGVGVSRVDAWPSSLTPIAPAKPLPDIRKMSSNAQDSEEEVMVSSPVPSFRHSVRRLWMYGNIRHSLYFSLQHGNVRLHVVSCARRFNGRTSFGVTVQ